jgi:formiminotetrahydrofolate cyclodeaminase
MLTQKPVTELLDAFSSPDPTPGGGSAAALAGAMGAALLAMVAGLPKTRTGAPEERTALDAARTDLVRFQKRLTELVDRDTAAYDLVVAAYKKPKSTDEEKAARQRAIQDGMRAATEVPLETMQASLDALRAAHAVATHGNPSALSDVSVGAHLLMSALSGAMLNVGVNIGSLKDAAVADRIKHDVVQTLKASSEATRVIFTSEPVAELTRDVQTKLGLPLQAPPSPEQFHAGMTEMLRRLGTEEARKALEALATSPTASMRDAAMAALGRFSSGG